MKNKYIMYWSQRIESWPGSWLRLLFCIDQLKSWGCLIPEATAATTSIQPTGGQESPHPQQNIQSQQFKPSTTPAPIAIVAFASFYLLKMASPKVALEPKATTAMTFIGTRGGRESSHPVQKIESQGLRSSTTPALCFLLCILPLDFWGWQIPRRPWNLRSLRQWHQYN